jgi:hypothetical protein
VIVFKQEAYPDSYYKTEFKLITSQAPIKPSVFARIKSTNYLPDVLVVLEAKCRTTRKLNPAIGRQKFSLRR